MNTFELIRATDPGAAVAAAASAKPAQQGADVRFVAGAWKIAEALAREFALPSLFTGLANARPEATPPPLPAEPT